MQLSPPDRMRALIMAHVIARCIHVVAEGGVADAMGDEPAPADELARCTEMSPDALARILRLLATEGIFERRGAGYVHTPASALLRSDHPRSMRALARMIGAPRSWGAFTDFAHAARTGMPAKNWSEMVAYFASHPDEASLFNQAMTGKAALVTQAVTEAYDFRPFRTIADIGGGKGHLLRAILERAPGAEGILFELPHVISDAKELATSRMRLMQGDFFSDPLPAADAYVLMEVLHDWSDADASRILHAVRRAAPAGARLIVVETLLPDGTEPHFAHTMDIMMLAITGGRERTRAEYERLLGATGFRLERVVPTASGYVAAEAVCV